MTKPAKLCNLAKGEWCKDMAEVAWDKPVRRGICILEMRNVATFDVSTRSVVYKLRSSPTESPLALACCPWCRADLGVYQPGKQEPVDVDKDPDNA